MKATESAAVRAAALEARVLASIPLVRAMQARISAFDGERVELLAPFEANINDKGTAFAGSLSTLATLAGWSLATLVAEADGERCDAAVFRSQFEFLRPLRGELRAVATLADAAQLPEARARLVAGKRAKLEVAVVVGGTGDSEPAVRFSAGYAIWRSGSQPF